MHDFVLINEFDSVEQERLFREMTLAGTDLAQIESHFVGLLRMGLILCHEVVVTDSMLLDGRFFQLVSPHDLELRLGISGQPLGIRVLSPHTTLREALEAKMADSNFVWQLSSADDADTFPSTQVQARWDEWLLAEERGAISVRPFSRHTTNTFSETLNELLNDPSRRQLLSPGIPRGIIERAQNLGPKRSDAFSFFDSLTLDRRHASELQTWWNQSYLEAIARDQGAAWMTFQASSEKRSTRTFRIWDSLFYQVADASPAVYATLFYALRHDREKWQKALSSPRASNRHRRGNRALAGIAYLTANHLSSSGRGTVALRALLTVALGVIGFVFAQTGANENPELSWVVVIVAVIALPWHELHTLIGAIRSKRGGVLKID